MRRDRINPDEIFRKATQITDPAKRAAYLDDICKGDQKLRADVEELLSAHEQGSVPLGVPAVSELHTLEKSGQIESPGTRIGRYEVLELIGEGGMGLVYLAEQKKPVRRRVALKIIKPGMDSKQVVARFEAERQALALLDHPNIAHVFDAGATKTGRPYFVMEYVKGMSIIKYCDEHKFNIEERLELFKDVCEGVQHAHQKGIIHRDIKPSNILVSIHGDKVVPKIIDFGIAKATAQALTDKTFLTYEGELLGTPEYMSPEQVDLATQDIDTRSDIYSLGAVLYELLTGISPFDSETLREGGIEHIRHVLREEEPRTPSTRLTSLGKQATKVAQQRRTEVGMLARRLHKELEWIPLKAMRKERARRYRSASELADDLGNYLQGAPLTAGPESTVYRVRKFVRRNRAFVTGVAAVLGVLAGGVIVSTILAIGQARARVEVQAIAEFLSRDVLGSVSEAKADEATVSYVLDTASNNLEGKFADQPLIEAWIRQTLGWTHRLLGESSKAEEHLLRALEIYQERYGKEHLETLGAMRCLASVYHDQGRHYDAEELWTDMLRITRRVHRVKHPLGIMSGLAETYYHRGNYKQAASFFEEYLQAGPGERMLPFVQCNLARVYAAQGRYEEAERLFLDVLKTDEWDEAPRWRVLYTNALANMYREQGRFEQAEAESVKTLETAVDVLGDKHPYTMESKCGLARVYTAQALYEKAEGLLNEALEIARRRLRKEHPATLGFVNALAVLRSEQGSYDEAESLFGEVLAGRQCELGDDHPDTLESKNDLAVLHKKQGDYDKAEPLLIEAVDGRRLKLGDTHPHTIRSLNNLIELYEAWGKAEEAEKWRASLPRKEGTKE